MRKLSASKQHEKLLIILLGLCAVAALALLPGARAADFTAATEAELAAAINATNAAGVGDHIIALTADITLTAPLPALNNTAASGILLDLSLIHI